MTSAAARRSWLMTHDDGETTTPIPRASQARLANEVRVRKGVSAVESSSGRIAVVPADAVAEVDPAVLRVRTGVRAVRQQGLRRGSVVAESYRILDRIARGGTAVVYRAEHMGLRRTVALKVLTPPSQPRPGQDFERRFITEARTLASLNHPNIVQVFDFGRIEDGRCYLAMEYVDGPRLSDLFQDPALSNVERLDVLIQVCRGIQHAHRQGVIHRDVKLSNALVVQRGARRIVKVLDFGLAKLTGETDPELTAHGLTLGSPHFMSPEQARGWDLDHRTDIYSLGVLAWCAFTGDYPYAGANAAATMLQQVVEPVPWLSRTRTVHPVPEGLCDTIRRCMAKDREDRFDDVDQLIEALEQVRAHAVAGRLHRDVAPAAGLPAPANGFPVRLALLGTLLVGVACLWWQERGVVPPPWTVAFHERRRGGVD